MRTCESKWSVIEVSSKMVCRVSDMVAHPLAMLDLSSTKVFTIESGRTETLFLIVKLFPTLSFLIYLQ